MLKAGDILRDRYRIECHIKKGGMGRVYQAWDNHLGNRVAIKCTETINQKFSESTRKKLRIAFEREARLLSKLRHLNLPIATDYFEQGNNQYLVMDYIDGEDLQQQLKNQATPFSVEQVLQWADSLLDTLTYLHGREKPLIHRDIKPANLKVTASGKIMLLDFGLAKGGLPEEPDGTIVYGKTLGYSPPEQIALSTTDERSDLYALAATLYYLLTAKRPIDAKLRLNAAENDVADPLKPLNEVNPKVSAALAKVLASAMALESKERPASAAKMRAMLKDAVELGKTTPVAARKPQSLPNYVVSTTALPRPPQLKPKKRPQSSRLKLLLLAVIPILLALFAILVILKRAPIESLRLFESPVAVVSESPIAPSLVEVTGTIISTPSSETTHTTTLPLQPSPTPELESTQSNTPPSPTAAITQNTILPTVTRRNTWTPGIPTVTKAQYTAVPTQSPIPTITPPPIPQASDTSSSSHTSPDSPTETRVPAHLSRVSLMSPTSQTRQSQGTEITFEWFWDGNLEGNTAPTYQITILRAGQVVSVDNTRGTSYRWQCDQNPEEYEWNVVVFNADSFIEETRSLTKNLQGISGNEGN